MKLISVVTPCYNEAENIARIYGQVKAVMGTLPDYSYEHIFIDNASSDQTVPILKALAYTDKNIKIIVATRNFGHVRSPFYGLLQTSGDAVITLAADLQDPPELIPTFLKQWEAGYKIVAGVKVNSQENWLMFRVRRLYYRLIGALSDIEQISDFVGFGLFDRAIIDLLAKIDDPYPYFRGLISDLGYPVAKVGYHQAGRRFGRSKNNFYTLFDLAMLGITNHSKIPLRLATIVGVIVGLVSLLVAFGYFVYKLFFWTEFTVGIAPLVIGLFFFSAVQLFFIGIIGEYIGAIHTQILKRPLVIEKERINF